MHAPTRQYRIRPSISSRPIPQLPQHVIPALLLKHQRRDVLPIVGELALLVLLAQLLERCVDMVLTDHHPGLAAASLGPQLRAQRVEVEGAGLKVGIGLELVPAMC